MSLHKCYLSLSGVLDVKEVDTAVQEDMRSFVLNNWSPALQAAFGEHWREHFQARPQHSRSDDDSGASSSHVFEGLLPRSTAVLEEANCEDPAFGSPRESDRDGAEQELFLGRGSRIRTFETRSMEVRPYHLHQHEHSLGNCRARQAMIFSLPSVHVNDLNKAT